MKTCMNLKRLIPGFLCYLGELIPEAYDGVYIVTFENHKLYFKLSCLNYSQNAAYLTPSGDKSSYLLKPQLLTHSVNLQSAQHPVHENAVSSLSVADRSMAKLERLGCWRKIIVPAEGDLRNHQGTSCSENVSLSEWVINAAVNQITSSIQASCNARPQLCA